MKRPRLLCTILLAAAACLAAGAVFAEEGPIQVGEEVFVSFQTPRPTAAVRAGEMAWREVIRWPGASYICVHFSEFDLAGGERVEVRTPDGLKSYDLTGRGTPGNDGVFWAPFVPGDTCEVILWGSGQRPGNGFAIDSFAYGYPLPPEIKDGEPPTAEAGSKAICGTDDKQWAKCYETSEPTIYQRGRAVARLLIQGTSACTGWLVGTAGHILTNNHCISTQAAANNTSYEFMAEGATCATNCASWGGCPGTIVTTTGTMVRTNAPMDYTLIQLSTNPTGTYGYLQLRQAGGTVGERMYIPQHPQAYGKQIAVTSTAPQDPGGYPLVYSKNEPACQTGGPPDVGYFADTEGGSSGSPVLAYSDHRVIALHHCAYCPNRGVPIESVITDLGADLPPGSVTDGPTLIYQSNTFVDTCATGGPGDHDGVFDPGETASYTITVQNAGNQTATSVSVQIASPTAGISVVDGTATYGNIAAGASATNGANALILQADQGMACGTPFTVNVTMTASNGGPWTGSFTGTVGTPGGAVTLYAENFDATTPPALPAGWATQVITGNAWANSNSNSCSSPNSLRYPYHGSQAANSWAYTPGLALTGGTTYTVNFNYKTQSSAAYPESLEVWVGTAQNNGAMTTMIWSLYNFLQPTTCAAAAPTFTPSTSGTYYIGFHCVSAADMWYLFVDDVNVTYPSAASCTVCTGGGGGEFDMSFQDQYNRSEMCLDSTTGDYLYSVLSGPGAGQSFMGTAIILQKAPTLFVFSTPCPPGSTHCLTGNWNVTRHTASVVLRSYSPQRFSSSLFDADYTDTPPCDGGGGGGETTRGPGGGVKE